MPGRATLSGGAAHVLDERLPRLLQGAPAAIPRFTDVVPLGIL